MATGHAVNDRLAHATRGEQLVYLWLTEALPDPYDVWHEPRTAAVRPDVVVFGPQLGLLVLEVKDWSPASIAGLEAGNRVLVRKSDGPTSEPHPLEQAQQSLYAIKEALEKCRPCVNAAGKFQGKIAFPFGKGAILPNMRRADVEALGLARGYDADWILTADDIGEPKRWTVRDAALSQRLGRIASARFDWKLTAAMRGALHEVLSPETTVTRDYAGRTRSESNPGPQLFLPIDSARPFSLEQQQIARELSGSHQVLQGVAGSGKSEVIAMRARILADASPAWRILVLCFNISLGAWLRARIFEGGAFERHDLTVAHFHQWARDLLDRAGIAYSSRVYAEPDGFPRLLLDALRSRRITRRYDAVIVDEGQDFSPVMLQAVLAALDEKRSTFLLAMDNAQKIYDGEDVPLSRIGINAQGNTRFLKTNLRCSREINVFSSRFLFGDGAEGETIRVGDQRLVVPISGDRCGAPVETPRCKDVEEQAEWAAACCAELAERGHLPDEMAVLYTTSRVGPLGEPLDDRPGDSSGTLVELLQRKFEEARMPLAWLSRDHVSKSDAALEQGRVALSTVHSFKGLEARNVVLFGADLPRAAAERSPRRKALLYVGMTRATDRLIVPWSNPDGLGPELESLART